MSNKWTQTVIFIVAIVSGVLNYDGLSSLVAPDDWWLKCVCAMTGAAVTLSLSLFWNWAFGTVPELLDSAKRLSGWATTIAGVALIVALSTYWNIVSLAGSEINRLAAAQVVEKIELQYAQAIRTVQSYRGFVADLSSLHRDMLVLQEKEITSGGTSSSAGAGAVSNTMGQVAGRVDAILGSVQSATKQVDALQTKGDKCLADLRQETSADKTEHSGEHLSCLNGVIAQMAGQDILSTLVRGLNGLTSGIVLPANIRTKKQGDIIEGFIADSKSRADAIAETVVQYEQGELPEPLSLERPNIMRGVIEHWQSIIPAIATALGLDLLPLVILLFKTLGFDDRRQRNDPINHWTAIELIDALQQLKRLNMQLDIPSIPKLDLPDYIDLEVNPETPDQSSVVVTEMNQYGDNKGSNP